MNRMIKMNFIGLGGRGTWWLGELLKMEDVEITAVCDKHEDRMEHGRKLCEVANRMPADHERAWQYLHRNAELYPTHELGPIMTYLDINRGNRLMSLTSTASKSRGLNKYLRDKYGDEHPLANADFRLGDVVTTTIRCANGETVLLTHDTSSPRPYSRGGRVQGTCGIWMEDLRAIHIEGRSQGESWDPMTDYYEEFEHPLWKITGAADFTGGHGGMDWLVMRAFLEAVRRKIQTPIDVYDSATLMAVGILSEESISLGSTPVAIPDFTDGMWLKREAGPKSVYSLAEVDDSIYTKDVQF